MSRYCAGTRLIEINWTPSFIPDEVVALMRTLTQELLTYQLVQQLVFTLFNETDEMWCSCSVRRKRSQRNSYDMSVTDREDRLWITYAETEPAKKNREAGITTPKLNE